MGGICKQSRECIGFEWREYPNGSEQTQDHTSINLFTMVERRFSFYGSPLPYLCSTASSQCCPRMLSVATRIDKYGIYVYSFIYDINLVTSYINILV